jgi:hypothetical protein
VLTLLGTDKLRPSQDGGERSDEEAGSVEHVAHPLIGEETKVNR